MAQSSRIADEVIEVGIIGSILKKPDLYYYCEMVKPSMFTKQEHQAMFWVCSELAKTGVEKIDSFSVISKLREKEPVYKIFKDEIESRSFDDIVSKLKMVGTTDAPELQRRVERLVTLDFRRQIPNKLRDMAVSIERDDDSHVNELNGKIHSDIMQMSEKYLIGTQDLPMLGDIIDDIMIQIDERVGENGVVGLPSVFPAINDFFTYEECELVVIGAPKKTGKSALSLNEGWHKASQGIPTLILDTELATRQYTERLLSHITQIPVRAIKSKTYSEQDGLRLIEAVRLIKEAPLAHIYLPEKCPNWSFSDIFLFAKSYQQKMGLQFLIYDYIKMNQVGGAKSIAEHDYLGDATEYLKNTVAGRLKISVLAFAQMDKTAAYLAGSDKISRYASVVCYLREKPVELIASDGIDAGTHSILIKNNRLGRQAPEDESEFICLHGDLDRMTFRETKKQPHIDKVDIF